LVSSSSFPPLSPSLSLPLVQFCHISNHRPLLHQEIVSFRFHLLFLLSSILIHLIINQFLKFH
jgi:hypothetical protein